MPQGHWLPQIRLLANSSTYPRPLSPRERDQPHCPCTRHTPWDGSGCIWRRSTIGRHSTALPRSSLTWPRGLMHENPARGPRHHRIRRSPSLAPGFRLTQGLHNLRPSLSQSSCYERVLRASLARRLGCVHAHHDAQRRNLLETMPGQHSEGSMPPRIPGGTTTWCSGSVYPMARPR